jgi:hypothetical protein
MVGGRRAYFALPEEERREVHETAKQMFEAGLDIATAHICEKTDRRGFVYVIWNPAWPAYVKVGRAFNPLSRLAQFQSGCPERDYKLKYAVYFENCYEAERLIHNTLADYRAEGEWFRILPTTAEHVLDQIGGYI